MNSWQPFVFRDGINSPVDSHWRNVLGVVPNIAAASPIFTNLRSITTDYVRLWENTTNGKADHQGREQESHRHQDRVEH